VTPAHALRSSLLALTLLCVPTFSQAQEARRPAIAAAESLSTMTLLRSGDGKAVVRFGATAPLEMLSAGDRVGRTAARVVSIAAGRLVLEDVTAGADGKPLRSEIVFRDGQTGGKRFLNHPDLNAPVGLRPEVVEPAPPAVNAPQPPVSRR
jgi:hypothetical protein